MKKLCQLLLAALFLQLSISQNLSAATDVEQLQQRLANIHTLQANFSQVVRHGSKIIQQSQGSFAVVRPGRFRWDSVKPIKQLLIADGKKLWIYDKELNQVSVKPISKGISGTPAFFLSGYDQSIGKYYYVKERPGKKQGDISYTLSPRGKSEATFRYILVNFSGKNLTFIQLEDHLGQTSEVHFSQMKVNTKLNPALFHFSVPKGADLIQEK